MQLIVQYYTCVHRLFVFHVIDFLYTPVSDEQMTEQKHRAMIKWNVGFRPSAPWHNGGASCSLQAWLCAMSCLVKQTSLTELSPLLKDVSVNSKLGTCRPGKLPPDSRVP